MIGASPSRGTVIAIAGIALGLIGSAVWPWGWAPPPPPAAQVAQPGRLLEVDDGMALVHASTLRQFGPPAAATGVVQYLRGPQHGLRRAWVECSPGGMLLIERELPHAWGQGATLPDLIARAMCAEHPLAQRDIVRAWL